MICLGPASRTLSKTSALNINISSKIITYPFGNFFFDYESVKGVHSKYLYTVIPPQSSAEEFVGQNMIIFGSLFFNYFIRYVFPVPGAPMINVILGIFCLVKNDRKLNFPRKNAKI